MKTKILGLFLSGLIVLSGCQNASNTLKGGVLGGSGGAALGAIIGAVAGKGKGAAIGAGIGAVVGTGAGVLIGQKMDKAKKAAQAANAQAEVITNEETGLTYVKATFSSGILFASGSSELSAQAKQDLATLAKNLDSDLGLMVYGYTDNTGFKNSTAEQSYQKNITLSQNRALSVQNCLVNNGVASSRFQEVKGFGQENPVADNSTDAGKEQNRRVEVYIIPTQATIDAAKKQAGE